MIPKAERDADAAILAAATGGEWATYSPRSQDGGVSLASFGGLDAPNVAVSLRVAGEWHIGLRQEQEGMPWEQHAANAKAAAHAVNRLPVYIEAMAEMERRIDALIDHLSGRVEELDEAGGSKSDRQYGVMAGLAQARKAVRDILRGGK